MNWIFLTMGAQLINAVVAVLDKYIVSDEKSFPRPFVYAFYTCLISGAWIVVYFIGLIPIPWEGMGIPSLKHVERPTLVVVGLSFLAAYAFFLALVSMFNALKSADASDVVPVIGSVSAVCSFVFGYVFLGNELSANFMMGIALLSVGTVLVSKLRFPLGTGLLSIHSGFFFAIHYVALKGMFLMTSFDNGFFWSRIAFVVFALSLLLVPRYLERIRGGTSSTGKRAGVIIVMNKVLAGVSTILILKATDMGDVAVVQALGGLQFIFILIFGYLIGIIWKRTPCGESKDGHAFLQKSLFVGVITLGFLVLFI